MQHVETVYGQWHQEFGLLSREFEIPFAGKPCEITVKLEVNDCLDLTQAQIQAIDMILSLSRDLEPALAHLLYEDYLEALKYVSQETLGASIANAVEAWNAAKLGPLFIFVPVHGNSKNRFAILSYQAPWNPEHGIHILIKDGLVVERVDADLGTSHYEWSEYLTQ